VTRDMNHLTDDHSKSWRWFRRAMVAALPVCLLLVISWNLEPRHEGKTLSEWVAQGTSYYEGGSDDDTAQALRAMGRRILPTLSDWVQTRESRFKQRIEMLADRQSFIELHFESAELRRGLAVNGFRVLGTNAVPAIPTLVRLIDDPELGGSALGGLAAIGAPAWAILMSALTNKDPVVRRNAVGSLASDLQIEIPGTISALLDRIHDEDLRVGTTVLSVLGECERHPELIHPAIARVAADTNSPHRAAAITLLSRAGADPSISFPIFRAALECESADIRRRAVMGLARIESEGAMESLITALADSDPRIRATVAAMLGRFTRHPERIVPLLRALLTNDSSAVCGAALRGLSRFGPMARAAVPDLLRLYGEVSPLNPPMFKHSVAQSLLAIDLPAAVGAGIRAEDYVAWSNRWTNAAPRPPATGAGESNRSTRPPRNRPPTPPVPPPL
jgi:HEAT repeat protein